MLVFDVLCHYSFVDSWSCSFPLVLGTDWFWISCVLAGRFVCHNSVHQVTVKQNMRATVSWQLVLIPSFPSPTHQPHYLSFPVSETTWEWPTTWVVTVNGRSMVQPPFVLCLRIGLLFFFSFSFFFFCELDLFVFWTFWYIFACHVWTGSVHLRQFSASQVTAKRQYTDSTSDSTNDRMDNNNDIALVLIIEQKVTTAT